MVGFIRLSCTFWQCQILCKLKWIVFNPPQSLGHTPLTKYTSTVFRLHSTNKVYQNVYFYSLCCWQLYFDLFHSTCADFFISCFYFGSIFFCFHMFKTQLTHETAFNFFSEMVCYELLERKTVFTAGSGRR